MQPIDWQAEVERKLRSEQDNDSHTESNSFTFGPSSLSRCKRQCTIQKLGLEDHGINSLWNFHLGSRTHSDLENWFDGYFAGVKMEWELYKQIETDVAGPDIELTGRCDVFDEIGECIYDFKTRKSWNGFDEPSDSHKDQITTYMAMAGVEQAQLVYVIKSAPWDEEEDIIKQWPKEGFYEFDVERWDEIRDRAEAIQEALSDFREEHDRLPTAIDEVPFEPCGCWLCNSE